MPEWASVLLGVGVGALITGGLALLGQRWQIKAERERRHDELVSEHRGRLFDRQSETYVELLEYLGRLASRVKETYPMLTYRSTEEAPEDERPAKPTKEELAEDERRLRDLEARVSAYGSQELYELVDRANRQFNYFFLEVGIYEQLEARGSPQANRVTIEEKRGDFRESYRLVGERVRRELASP